MSRVTNALATETKTAKNGKKNSVSPATAKANADAPKVPADGEQKKDAKVKTSIMGSILNMATTAWKITVNMVDGVVKGTLTIPTKDGAKVKLPASVARPSYDNTARKEFIGDISGTKDTGFHTAFRDFFAMQGMTKEETRTIIGFVNESVKTKVLDPIKVQAKAEKEAAAKAKAEQKAVDQKKASDDKKAAHQLEADQKKAAKAEKTATAEAPAKGKGKTAVMSDSKTKVATAPKKEKVKA